MDEEKVRYYKSLSLSQCERLLTELRRNKEDADLFFGGELYKSYVEATDAAIDKTRKIRNKIRNLY